MAIYKKVNGKIKKFAENSVIDHNQLSNRDQYGAHSISAIRKLPEKLTALKVKDSDIEEKAKQIDIVENESEGTFTFTNYEGEQKIIQSGYKPDEDTLTLNDEKQMTLQKVYSDSTLVGDGIKANKLSVNIDNNTITKNSNGQIQSEAIKVDANQSITGAYIQSELNELNKDIGDIEKHDKKQDDNITDLQARTKGLGGYINAYDFESATPTQDQLTNYALTQISNITSKEEIFNQTKVVNLFDNHVWVLTNTPNSDPAVFEWADKGTEAVALANNDGVRGIVTGSYEELEGFVDINGHITINGLDKIAEKANLIKTDQTSDKYLDGSGNYSTVKTNASFNPSWNVSGTTLQFVEDIKADTSATVGHTYLGGVQLTDLPANLSNAECIVQIISSTLGEDEKVIHLDLYSSNTSPYHWSCIYWKELTTWQPDVLEEDLDTKVDKLSTTGTFDRAYIAKKDGTQGTLNIASTSAFPNALIQRDGIGRVYVRDATEANPYINSEAVNKKYIDEQLSNVTAGFIILKQSDFPLNAELLEKVKANPYDYCIYYYSDIYFYYPGVTSNVYMWWVCYESQLRYLDNEFNRLLSGKNLTINKTNGTLKLDPDTDGINEILQFNDETIKAKTKGGYKKVMTPVGILSETNNQTLSGDDIYNSLTIERL